MQMKVVDFLKPSGCQLPMPFEEPHQHGICMGEIRELALELIRPFLAVEKVVAKAPDNDQHRQQPISRGVVAPVQDRTNHT